MAQTGAFGAIFGIAGNFIGGYLGGPIGAAIGGLAGGLIGGLLFQPRPPIPDVRMMNSAYGRPIPILYGTARLPATMIWEDQVTVHKNAFALGKGAALGQQNPYSYHIDAMLAFCEGVASLIKIWLDGKLFLDTTSTAGEQTKYTFAVRTYDGTEDQLPDVVYANWCATNAAGATGVPAYRGIAYLMFNGIDLAHFGVRFPQVTATWSTNATFATTFEQLFPITPDGTTYGQTSNWGLAVDWTQGLVYQLTDDGTLRVYSIISRGGLIAKTYTQWGGETLPFTDGFSPEGIVCGQGTKLYAWSNGSGNKYYVWTLDPNTLAVLNTVQVTFSGIVGSNRPGQVQCTTIAMSNGSYDMLVGSMLVAGNPCWALNPATGLYAETDLILEDLFESADCIFGAQDPTTGNQDVWFLSTGPGETASQLYLEKATLIATEWVVPDILGYGPSPSFTASLQNTFVPSDFGDPHTGESVGYLLYDASDGTVLITGMNWSTIGTIKWNGANAVWTSTYTGGASINVVFDAGTLAGSVVYSGGIPILDSNTGTLSSSPVAGGSPGPNSIAPLQSYNSSQSAMVFYAGDENLYVAYLNRTTTGEVSVAEIIQDLVQRVGMNVDLVDVSLVTATCWGYVVTENMSAGKAIADLCNFYLLDMVESDFVLKFIPRGQAPVVTLTQDQLGSVSPDDPSQYWIPKRTQELDMPLQITIQYQDPALDYNPGAAYARRTQLPVPTVFSKRKRVMTMPIIAEALEARNIAQSLLFTMWAERTTYETVLSLSELALDPGDNITVNLDDGSSYLARIQVTEIGADLSMKLSLCSENDTTYSGFTLKAATFGTPAQTLVPAQIGRALLFNVPLLQDGDDTGGTSSRIYYAAGAFAPGWTTGGMYNNVDGTGWTVLSILPETANWGYCAGILGSTVSTFSTDYVNSIRITLTQASAAPVGCTYTDMMNGANAALVGSEIIQYQNVTANEDGTYTLSVLSRGRRGTEWAIGTHETGETFIMLAIGEIGTNRMPLSEIGETTQWALVSTGFFLDQVPNVPFAYLGYDLMPYAPVMFSRAPSGSDLVLAWLRRTRFGGWLVDGTDTVPLNEESELYDVYTIANAGDLAAFDPTNPATYVRAWTSVSSPTVTYTAAEMAADGFTPATDTLYLIVYQLSGVVGRGFQGYKSLPAF